jgi:hypothetical protein
VVSPGPHPSFCFTKIFPSLSLKRSYFEFGFKSCGSIPCCCNWNLRGERGRAGVWNPAESGCLESPRLTRNRAVISPSRGGPHAVRAPRRNSARLFHTPIECSQERRLPGKHTGPICVIATSQTNNFQIEQPLDNGFFRTLPSPSSSLIWYRHSFECPN